LKHLFIALSLVLLSACKIEIKGPEGEVADETGYQYCNPTESYPRAVCSDEIPHRLIATKEEVCNALGTGYRESTCIVEACEAGYVNVENTCLPEACTPGTAFPNVSCVHEIPFALTAAKTKVCNSTGTDFTYGTCQALTCGTGHHKSGNTCLADFVVSNVRVKYNGGAQESVPRIAANYAWADFRGIDSHDFYATWTATVTANTTNRLINIKTDQGWSSAVIKIDNVVVPYQDTIAYVFTPGAHTVEISYENNWHTTSFNVSFTDNAVSTLTQAQTIVEPLADDDTQVIYVGVYESNDFYNEISVLLQAQTKPVILVLNSYHAVNWKLSNPTNVPIKAIVYGAYAPGSTVHANFRIPKIQTYSLSNTYDSVSPPSLVTLTGGAADRTFGGYGVVSLTIPTNP